MSTTIHSSSVSSSSSLNLSPHPSSLPSSASFSAESESEGSSKNNGVHRSTRSVGSFFVPNKHLPPSHPFSSSVITASPSRLLLRIRSRSEAESGEDGAAAAGVEQPSPASISRLVPSSPSKILLSVPPNTPATKNVSSPSINRTNQSPLTSPTSPYPPSSGNMLQCLTSEAALLVPPNTPANSLASPIMSPLSSPSLIRPPPTPTLLVPPNTPMYQNTSGSPSPLSLSPIPSNLPSPSTFSSMFSPPPPFSAVAATPRLTAPPPTPIDSSKHPPSSLQNIANEASERLLSSSIPIQLDETPSPFPSLRLPDFHERNSSPPLGPEPSPLSISSSSTNLNTNLCSPSSLSAPSSSFSSPSLAPLHPSSLSIGKSSVNPLSRKLPPSSPSPSPSPSLLSAAAPPNTPLHNLPPSSFTLHRSHSAPESEKMTLSAPVNPLFSPSVVIPSPLLSPYHCYDSNDDNQQSTKQSPRDNHSSIDDGVSGVVDSNHQNADQTSSEKKEVKNNASERPSSSFTFDFHA